MIVHICNKCEFVIFRREEDYSMFINRLSIIGERYKIRVLAFTIMSNHFHLIVKGENYKGFISKIKQVFTQCWNKKYGSKVKLFASVYIRELESNKEVVDAINYTLKNPLHHSVTSNPLLYKYSSINYYFTKERNVKIVEDNHYNTISNVDALTYREKRRLFGSFAGDNNSLKAINYTDISIASFLDYKSVEFYYTSYKRFIYEMAKYTQDEIELFCKNNSREDTEQIIDIRCNKLSDLEVCKLIDDYIAQHGRDNSFIKLLEGEKEYLRNILSSLGVSQNQIMRCRL